MSKNEADKKWMDTVVKSSGKKIEESRAFISVFTPDFKKNPQCALELGIAILLDKPIILMVPEDEWIPPALRRLAHAVVPVDIENKESRERASRDLQEAMAKLEQQ